MSDKSIDSNSMDPGMMPIRITDAASMLRKLVDPNERPYTQAVYLNNNKLVDEWYEQILQKIANPSGQVRAGQVWGEWQYYYYGKILPQFMNHLDEGRVCRPTSKAITYWVDVFTKKNASELSKMGQAVVGHGWKLVTDETFIRSSIDKWEKIYSLTNDPLKWRKLAYDNPKLWAADFENPFWSQDEFKDVTQKVVTILKVNISPM